jgi:negative regulator of sigma E activity
MTNANDKQAPGPHVPGQLGERILDHNRLQLSALMDGAVSPDEARFLLRRLQHDEELAGCWTRWQLCGDVLRGNASTIVPAGFSQGVADAIAAETDRSARAGSFAASRWARWGGGAALAASVAVIALFVSRQMPGSQSPAPTPAQIATTAPATTPTSPIPAAPTAPDTAAQLAAAVAVADVPRRSARRSRGQSQRAAMRTPARATQAPVAIAAGAPLQSNPNPNPFAPNTVIQSRPWPRALLPNAPASGAFTVEYGSSAPSFYPFAPRTAIGPGAPADSDRVNTGDGDPSP